MKVTFSTSPGPSQPRTCGVHTATYSISPRDTPRSFVQRTLQPYRFGPHFRDEVGQPVCDRCVVEGLLEGTVEVVNAQELRRAAPRTVAGFETLNHEAPAVAAARDALDHWGSVPLGILERALEAAERHGRLEELARRLFAALPAIRHESEIEAPDEASRGSASHPPEIAGTVTTVAEGAAGEPTKRDRSRSPTGSISRRRRPR